MALNLSATLDPDGRAVTGPNLMTWWSTQPLRATMEQDWFRWIHSPDGRRTRLRWNQHREMAGCDPIHLADPVRQCGHTVGNQIQYRLAALAQDGCVRATATMIVQLRPGLIRVANASCRWPWRHATTPDEARSEVLATFLEVLLTTDLQRRGRRVAANLVNDTRQRLWRTSPAGWKPSTTRRPAAAGLPDSHHDRAQVTIVGSAATAIDEQADSDAVLDLTRVLRHTAVDAPDTAHMAYLAWFEERSVADIGARLGFPPSVVANRLYRLRRRLRTS